MASVPTFQVSEEEQPGESQRVKTAGGSRSLLSVPAPVRSNIGINNPDKAGSGSGLFPLPTSQQVVGSATGNPRNKAVFSTLIGRGISRLGSHWSRASYCCYASSRWFFMA